MFTLNGKRALITGASGGIGGHLHILPGLGCTRQIDDIAYRFRFDFDNGYRYGRRFVGLCPGGGQPCFVITAESKKTGPQQDHQI